MRSPIRFLRRRWEYAGLAPRKTELEAEFSRFMGERMLFQPADAKGGYDQIYLATSAGRTVAVVRANNPRRTQHDPIGPLDPGVPLGPAERLQREWEAYTRLSSARPVAKAVVAGQRCNRVFLVAMELRFKCARRPARCILGLG